MLILSAIENDRVFITTESGEEIIVTILEVRGKQVRAGFTAAKNVVVDREEIYNRKKAGIPIKEASKSTETQHPLKLKGSPPRQKLSLKKTD